MNTATPEIFELEAMQHLNDLYRTALRMTRNAGDAEDLIQETFMQAWKSFEQYEIGTNCRAWLYKIMFHKLDHFRRKKYTQAKYLQETEDETVFVNTKYVPPIPEILTDEEVIRALQKLPEHYREAVLLTDVHEFSYKEAAEILRIPIGTIMSRVSRARTHLKKSLAGVASQYGIKSQTFVGIV